MPREAVLAHVYQSIGLERHSERDDRNDIWGIFLGEITLIHKSGTRENSLVWYELASRDHTKDTWQPTRSHDTQEYS